MMQQLSQFQASLLENLQIVPIPAYTLSQRWCLLLHFCVDLVMLWHVYRHMFVNKHEHVNALKFSKCRSCAARVLTHGYLIDCMHFLAETCVITWDSSVSCSNRASMLSWNRNNFCISRVSNDSRPDLISMIEAACSWTSSSIFLKYEDLVQRRKTKLILLLSSIRSSIQFLLVKLSVIKACLLVISARASAMPSRLLATATDRRWIAPSAGDDWP